MTPTVARTGGAAVLARDARESMSATVWARLAGAQCPRAFCHGLEEIGQRPHEAAAGLPLPDLLELGEVLVHHRVDQLEVRRPDCGQRSLVDVDHPVGYERGVNCHVACDLEPLEQMAHELHHGGVAAGSGHGEMELEVELEEEVLVLEEVARGPQLALALGPCP